MTAERKSRRTAIDGAFAGALTRARKRQGLTQTDLAAKVGIGPTALTRIENGISLCNVGLAVELAEAVGTTVDNLLDGCRNCGGAPPPGFTCSACGVAS